MVLHTSKWQFCYVGRERFVDGKIEFEIRTFCLANDLILYLHDDPINSSFRESFGSIAFSISSRFHEYRTHKRESSERQFTGIKFPFAWLKSKPSRYWIFYSLYTPTAETILHAPIPFRRAENSAGAVARTFQWVRFTKNCSTEPEFIGFHCAVPQLLRIPRTIHVYGIRLRREW